MKRPILKVRVDKKLLAEIQRKAKLDGATTSHIARRLILNGIKFEKGLSQVSDALYGT